ncbi:MAG: hypothetical protein N3A69_13560, partial [Leptospiraceae bacterium]|nr:hypothetical protein [Leptospiraceae bacterium]
EYILEKIREKYSYQDEDQKLTKILRKCTEPRKENRFQNVQELKIEFIHFLKELPSEVSIEILVSDSVLDRIIQENYCNNYEEAKNFLKRAFEENEVLKSHAMKLLLSRFI